MILLVLCIFIQSQTFDSFNAITQNTQQPKNIDDKVIKKQATTSILKSPHGSLSNNIT